ncbi:MAG: hypothetical protein J7M24_06990 [Candidatus Latescibacteria bacterium]|nr:hypothetical protein [Candidatus Latescibacterota bacterium]
MNVLRVMTATLLCIAFTLSTAEGETARSGIETSGSLLLMPVAFPDLAERTDAGATSNETPYVGQTAAPEVRPAVWPFSGGDSDENTGTVKRKSSRKAFFLSFLLPGLGETYVGSKRGIINVGVEAVAWWLYLTNTRKGNDLENDFRDYANLHWHYTDDVDSNGGAIDYNYYKWLMYHFREVGFPDDVDPSDYATIDKQLESTVQKPKSSIFGHSVHNLPSTHTQQYYEMIGKYPQFVYGWEDIDDVVNGVPVNPAIRDENGTINYEEALHNIKSPLRNKYENMRNDSNQKLKAGQRGIHLMILNRVFSGIQAARMAYKHNKKLDSELSSIDIRFTEKYIIDNRVPMLLISKRLK